MEEYPSLSSPDSAADAILKSAKTKRTTANKIKPVL
jgi:hypothetical protein